MALLALNKVSLAYGHHPLLDEVDFEIEPGERVCLIGRNGSGKSTLFRVITGAAQADDGEIRRADHLKVSHLEQEVPADTVQSIFEVVAAGLGELGQVLAAYHTAAHDAATNDPGALHRLTDLQHRIDAMGGWNISQKVETVLSRLSLPADKRFADCSGGIRRQVMLAQALVSSPDLLLLDEPTNHLDISAITWLEEFLLGYPGALLFITHDRTFLQNLATRIVELDRGKLASFPGRYADYLKRKEQLLDAEQRANARFDKKLAEHEAWIRRGIKARRTRNEGRVKLLEAMRRARSQRLETQGQVNLDMDSGETSGKLVADLRHVGFSYGDHVIIRDFSTRILRGDRIGIMGPNGSGKSTLLKLILGTLQPTDGRVVPGTKLSLAYFDQQRAQLDTEKTVRENISEGRDYVNVKGRERHVIGYLKDFLFPPQRIDAPVKVLSGGERNRLLLAKLFTRPANMMVLDEPTNDLDVDTLELLEDLLADYDGTLLLVSHDRSFLDNVVTSTIVFEGDANVHEYVGGYADWLRQRRPPSAAPAKPAPSPAPATQKPSTRTARTQKLSYKDQRELDALPERIEQLEQKQRQLAERVSDGAFYQQDKQTITETLADLERIRAELEQAYRRWEQLETLT